MWYKIEYFTEGWVYAPLRCMNNYRVAVIERQYTSENRAWAAAYKMRKKFTDAYTIKVTRL